MEGLECEDSHTRGCGGAIGATARPRGERWNKPWTAGQDGEQVRELEDTLLDR